MRAEPPLKADAETLALGLLPPNDRPSTFNCHRRFDGKLRFTRAPALSIYTVLLHRGFAVLPLLFSLRFLLLPPFFFVVWIGHLVAPQGIHVLV